ncbi:hypothetical protein DAEQUDRAFT_741671 [Daedalea quercina L-15889]|uniref:Uncharacterized protein n=1 Tax=Daedalea quercina L-15889 TaxID=1314783 RepID=A0A165L0Z1_9APHY|nr:hypothetical protein DAEQUDRAFT_741671 [Daedalea quercina L-15889]
MAPSSQNLPTMTAASGQPQVGTLDALTEVRAENAVLKQSNMALEEEIQLLKEEQSHRRHSRKCGYCCLISLFGRPAELFKEYDCCILADDLNDKSEQAESKPHSQAANCTYRAWEMLRRTNPEVVQELNEEDISPGQIQQVFSDLWEGGNQA